MLTVAIKGLDETISRLDRLQVDSITALRRAMVDVAKGIHNEAQALLSGPGRRQMKLVSRHKTLTNLNRRNLRGQFSSLESRPGAYPVPVITGHLRRSLDWVKPGASKSGNGQVFSAGPDEVIIYNSARYARVIHDGTHSSTKAGKRPFLLDALKNYDRGGNIRRILDQRLQEVLP